MEESKSLVDGNDENGNIRPDFSFQDDVDVLKVFGPIATKKTIEVPSPLKGIQ